MEKMLKFRAISSVIRTSPRDDTFLAEGGELCLISVMKNNFVTLRIERNLSNFRHLVTFRVERNLSNFRHVPCIRNQG